MMEKGCQKLIEQHNQFYDLTDAKRVKSVELQVVHTKNLKS